MEVEVELEPLELELELGLELDWLPEPLELEWWKLKEVELEWWDLWNPKDLGNLIHCWNHLHHPS
jgi:hypothetical protein